jgi:large subunit ribosomal protein L4
MKIEVLNQKGEKVKDLLLSSTFDVELSQNSLALYVNYLRNALRSPIANSKDRSEVSGGGKKPWKQKGTGRARHGSTRSPLWVGGGVTFGPTNDRNFNIKINKSMKRNVILGVLSEAFKQKKTIVLESLALKNPKTKDAVSILENINADGKISVVISASDQNAERSFRNIGGINLMTPQKLNVIDLFSSDKIVMSVEGIDKLEEVYKGKK